MSDQKLNEILEVCMRYQNNANNYYTLFNINPNASIDEINASIRKAKIMFHPDQANFIPDEYKQIFNIISEKIPNLVNTFSSAVNRSKYDSDLAKAAENSTKSNYQQPQQNDLELNAKLQSAIISQANKYGWSYTLSSFTSAIEKENFGIITGDNGARNILASIGSNKIRNMILNSSLGDVNNNLTFKDAVMNYVTDMFSSNVYLKNNLDSINKACIETTNKYGPNQTLSAIRKYINDDDCISFTNNNGARDNMIENYTSKIFNIYQNVSKIGAKVSYEEMRTIELEFYMQVKLNSMRFENPNLSYANSKRMDFNQLSANYVNCVSNNYGQYGGNFSK